MKNLTLGYCLKLREMNKTPQNRVPVTQNAMSFFNSAVDTLRLLVIALGGGLAVWGGVNLLEGYGNDNRATRS
jgi:hypothetical protein